MSPTDDAGDLEGVRSLKTMLRCRDFDAARRFYVEVLGLEVVEEWDSHADKGCIVGFGPDGGFLELLAASPEHAKHRPAFEELVANDKIELQIRVESVDAWVTRLYGIVEMAGPGSSPPR